MMGTTFGGIHVYTDAPILFGDASFRSFSAGWQTCVSHVFDDVEDGRKFARQLSKNISAAVLFFYLFDSEEICFYLYRDGKTAASFSSYEAKKIFDIPALVGYAEGNKRRLSKILSCADTDFLIEMLEEFFGVCLLPLPEILEADESELHRERCDKLYTEFIAEEKKFTGKNAAVKAMLVKEYRGKLYTTPSYEQYTREHCFWLTYEDEASAWTHEGRRVEFRDGDLYPISEEEWSKKTLYDDSEFQKQHKTIYLSHQTHFFDHAPSVFAGKTVSLPRGFYPYGFDGKERLILCNEKGSLIFMESPEKTVARITYKDDFCDIRDEFFLTAKCNHAGFYDPNATIRIYRLDDKE